mgnify:CR=1 FL=1
MILSRLDSLIRVGQLKQWQGLVEKERREHSLKYLFWETTHACPLSCRHCGSDCGKPLDKELSTDEIKGALKSISRDFDAEKIMIAITGGEPLMRKDLFEVMKFARSLGFRWGLVTSGMLVNEQTIRLCEESDMSTVTVSIDGLEETHDMLRGAKGSFNKAVDALRMFKESGKFEVVQATTCVSQYNIAELPALHALFTEMGIDEWRLLTVNPIGRAKDDKRLTLKPAQFRSLMEFIVERRKNKAMKTLFEEEGFLGIEYEGRVRDSLFYCPAGVNVGSILCDGSISACPNLPRTFIQGNVRKDSFKDVWENGFRIMRNLEWKKRGMCSKCVWWTFCKGNSLHLWDEEAGRPSVCHIHMLQEAQKT